MRPILAALALLVASSAAAQTIEATYPLTGWGPVQVTALELDGKPGTQEWAVRAITYGMSERFRVVVVREGRVCVGDWFEVAGTVASGAVSIQTVSGRSKLVLVQRAIFVGENSVRVVAFDRPSCE